MQLHGPGCRVRVLVLGAGPPTTGGIPTFLSLLEKYANSDPQLALDFINCSPSSERGIWRRVGTSLRVSLALSWKLLMRHDVVHVHVSGQRSFFEKSAFCVICRVFRTPAILHFHASFLPPYYEQLPILGKKIVVWLLRQPYLIVVPYSSLVAFFEDTSKRQNVRVIANGIKVPPDKPRREMAKSQVDVVFLGHIMAEKGLFVLLEALTRMKEMKHRLVVHLAGAEKRKGDLAKIKETFEGCGLRDVHFYGHLGDTDKDNLLMRGDIFVLPSLEEAFPFAVLEAMSYALPIVATRVGGVPEILEDGVNGYLIEPGDADQLATALIELAENREARLRMGDKNYQKVRELYSFQETFRKLKVVYAEAAERRQGNRAS